MNCPRCGQKLRISKKDPSYGLCDNCRKRFKIKQQEGYYTDDMYDSSTDSHKKKYANLPPSKVRSSREKEMRQGYDDLLAIKNDKQGIGSTILSAVIILLAVAIVGVGVYIVYTKVSKDNETKSKSTTTTTTDKSEKTDTTDTTDGTDDSAALVTRDLAEGDYADTGEGFFSVSTPSGSSADGSVPILYVSAAETLSEISYSASGINGGSLSYIYIDGYLNSKAQLAESEGTLDIQSTAINSGTHKVEVVQYENDDPAAVMTMYKTCSYEIKEQ